MEGLLPPDASASITHKLKSPRLAGSWALTRFLHNGSVDTLEALFCLGTTRGAITTPAYGDYGHEETCQGLSAEEKRALAEFLGTPASREPYSSPTTGSNSALTSWNGTALSV